MKVKFLLFALVFALAGVALAQGPPAMSGPDIMHGFHPPAALMSDWWNDPEVANELHLTPAQKQKLEQASTNLKLTMIDAGATAMKSYVRLTSQLDADQVDSAAFNQDLNAASAAAANLIKDVGQMVLTVRTTLTADQWHSLEAMHGRMRGHMEMHDGHGGMHGGMHEDMHPAPKPAQPRTPPQ